MQHRNNLIVPRLNYYEFGTKSLTSVGPKIWNSLPVNIKTSKHGTEKCVSAICAHIRLIKSCENKQPKNRSYYHDKVHIF